MARAAIVKSAVTRDDLAKLEDRIMGKLTRLEFMMAITLVVLVALTVCGIGIALRIL